MRLDPALIPREDGGNGGLVLFLSPAGGLTQFGANIDTLAPGGFSSSRHWHDSEDELLFMLQGTATLIDDGGEHILTPGDAACWPHGCPDAHHLTNRTDAPCTYLVIGTRVAGDICTYPDSGSRQVNTATTWAVFNAGGGVERSRDLPPELLNLPPVWGTPFDPAHPGQRIIRRADQPPITADDTPHPILGGGLGPYATQLLSDPGGLSQFGAFIETLPPGSRSGFRHWHETEDEMIYVLSGTPTLIEDTETILTPGDVACWPAGLPMAHCLANRSGQPVRYLVIGTRHDTDRIHYPDHDLVTTKNGLARTYARPDGRSIDPGAAA